MTKNQAIGRESGTIRGTKLASPGHFVEQYVLEFK